MIGTDRHAFVAPVIATPTEKGGLDESAMANRASSDRVEGTAMRGSPSTGARRRRNGHQATRTGALLLSLLAAAPTVDAKCYSLSGSTECPAFTDASFSTNSTLVGIYPFLQYVSSTTTFDAQLKSYVQTSFVQEHYESLLGCGNIDLSNTTELYARFTTSVICNGIVQNSIDDCGLSGDATRPLCADSCAQYAESEEYIISDSSLCSSTSSNSGSQIRADFTNCALPADSLSSTSCIPAIDNESQNCGYGNSTVGLCSYCASGGINSTDTCCYESEAQTRCANVTLPSITPTMSFGATSTPTASSAAQSGSRKALSGGAIAGIVIGTVVAAALLAFLAFMCIRLARRRRRNQDDNVLNRPSPSRKGASTTQIQSPPATAPQGYEVLPGGRIARMSALEGHSRDAPSSHGDFRRGDTAGAAAAGAAAGFMAGHRSGDQSSSEDFGESPASERRAGALRSPPTMTRRNGSLNSSVNSMLIADDAQSPGSAGGMSTPQGGVASQQSEQLPFFKDYYSQDDIQPNDRVAVLWAYQPRAPDEFALERGDMLKVVGIWDDGWATGVMVDERADEWEARRQAQRDSGVSHTSGRTRDVSPPVSGEIKAFPLVCVCLPEHWRKTIEGDGSTETASSAL